MKKWLPAKVILFLTVLVLSGCDKQAVHNRKTEINGEIVLGSVTALYSSVTPYRRQFYEPSFS